MILYRTMTADEFRGCVASIRSCGGHSLSGLTSDMLAGITEVLVARYETYAYGNTRGDVLVQLADGTVGHFLEWSNSPGHG